jgi:hypothetical protein
MGSSRRMWARYKHRRTILDRRALVHPQHSTARLWPGPYSTGLPGSSIAMIDHIRLEAPDAGNDGAGLLSVLAKAETHKKRWSSRSPEMVQETLDYPKVTDKTKEGVCDWRHKPKTQVGPMSGWREERCVQVTWPRNPNEHRSSQMLDHPFCALFSGTYSERESVIYTLFQWVHWINKRPRFTRSRTTRAPCRRGSRASLGQTTSSRSAAGSASA